jgi:hypothetical protein
MAKLTVNTGSNANSRDGDSLRAAFTKINANFTELYTNIPVDISDLTDTTNLLGTGGGTANTGDITFTDTTISAPSDAPIVIAADSLESSGASYYFKNSGLSIDNGYAFTKSQYQLVSANTNEVVYVQAGTSGAPRVIKLIIKADMQGDYQACEMLVVRSDNTPPSIRFTVYAVIHTSNEVFATFAAQWNNDTGAIEITARNTSELYNMGVEAVAIEVNNRND